MAASSPCRVSWLKFEPKVSNFACNRSHHRLPLLSPQKNFASYFLYVMNVFLLIVFINVIKVSSTNFFVCEVASSPCRVSWLKIEPWSRFLPVMEASLGFYYFHYIKYLCYLLLYGFYLFSLTIYINETNMT